MTAFKRNRMCVQILNFEVTKIIKVVKINFGSLGGYFLTLL